MKQLWDFILKIIDQLGRLDTILGTTVAALITLATSTYLAAPGWAVLLTVTCTIAAGPMLIIAWKLLRQDYKKQPADLQRDTATFQKLDAIADESLIDNLINYRIYTSTFKTDDATLLTNFIHALQRIENRYLDDELRMHAETLCRELTELSAIVFRTFFSIGDGWLKFYPDRIDSRVYDKALDELNQIIDNGWRAYRAYRTAVKKRLRV